MSRSKLRIVGPWPAWSPELREAVLRPTGGDASPRRVLIRVLTGVDPDPKTLSRLREQASLLSRLPANGMLRQVHVTRLEGHAALVYDFIEAPSLARILQAQASRGSLLPGRVCASICAQVARSLASFQRSLRDQPKERSACHRGPGTDDVLIQTDGSVLLSGASVGPPPNGIPGYTPPEGPGGEAALVYGIGALAAAAWTARRPPPSHRDPKRHKQVMRTVLTALQSRPGEPTPEALLRLIGACMQPLPADRPALEMVCAALSRLADTMQGPTLHAWAGVAVPTTMAWSKTAPSHTETAPPPIRAPLNVAPLGPEDDPTTLAPNAPPDEDDETMVASPESARLIRDQILAAQALGPPPASDDELAPPKRLDPPPVSSPLEPLPRPTRPNQTLVIPEPDPLPPVPQGYPDELGRNPTLMPSDEPAVEEGLEATRLMAVPKLRGAGGDDEPTVAMHVDMAELSDSDLESESAPLPRHRPLPSPVSGAPEPEVAIGGISDTPAPPPPPEPPPKKKRSWLPFAAMFLGFVAASAGAAWYLLRDPVEDIELGSGPVEQIPTEAELEPVAEPDPAPSEPIADPPTTTPAPPSEERRPATEPEPITEPEPAPEAAPPPEPVAEPEPEPAPEPEAVAEVAPAPEPVDEPRVVVIPADEPDDEEEAEAEAIVPRLGGGSSPEPAEEPAADPEPASDPIKADGGFQATFASPNPAVTTLKVKCHQGTSSGSGPVTVSDAQAGPCRVQATTADGMLVAFFTLQGPGSYTCFQDGARECR